MHVFFPHFVYSTQASWVRNAHPRASCMRFLKVPGEENLTAWGSCLHQLVAAPGAGLTWKPEQPSLPLGVGGTEETHWEPVCVYGAYRFVSSHFRTQS